MTDKLPTPQLPLTWLHTKHWPIGIHLRDPIVHADISYHPVDENRDGSNWHVHLNTLEASPAERLEIF